MTSDLQDLDLRCARAMGWQKPSEQGRCDRCGWPVVPDRQPGCWVSLCSMRPPPETRADAVPQYSSAPHLLDAKLAWLNRHVWLGAVHIVEEPMRLPKPATWFTFAYELPGAAVRRGVAEEQRLQFTGRGATIHEAVARLVVAVADANYPAEAAGGVT